MASVPKYYQPYVSDEESRESDDSDTDSDRSSDTSDSAAKDLDDPRYAIIRASGPQFTTINEQLLYQRGKALGSTYVPDASANIMQNSLLYKDPKKTIQTTLFSFKSQNRDTNVWPTSSDFEIKLPRPYKNVTQIQLVQVSYQYFLNTIIDQSGALSSIVEFLSTIGFKDASECLCCFNNTASILNSIAFTEVGRSDPLDPTKPLIHTVTVRGGRYDNNLLAQEINYQLNKTPPFNLISYAEHRTKFRSSKNLDHLFNEGGNYFYNHSQNQFLSNPTRKDIHNHYFTNLYVQSNSQPTENETFVAYYYPVLKHVLMSNHDHNFLDFGMDTFETVYNRVVQHFEGFNSSYYYTLIKENIGFLRPYREQHTFKYYPIHEYKWNYDEGMKRFSIQHSALHPSIQKDIQNTHAIHFTQALHHNSLSINQYNNLLTQHERTKAVLTDLQKKIDSALTSVGIPFGLQTSADIINTSHNLATSNPLGINTLYLSETDTVVHDIATGLLSKPLFSGTYARSTPYTFGRITISDLVADSQNYLTFPANFESTYATALSTLNANSVVNERLGAGNINGYSGVQLAISDFSSLYSTFTNYYNQHISQASTLNAVTTMHDNLTQTYVQNKYTGVLPPSLLSNNAYLGSAGTGKIQFRNDIIMRASTPFLSGACTSNNPCCQYIEQAITNWYGCIPAEYVITTLPWKLGLTVTPSDILQFLSTLTNESINTPYNVYLQLNIDKSMNNMDVAMKEDSTITNEPVAESKVVLGKLLTEGSGLSDITQTIIQNPAQFATPIGKLDRLHFTMYLDDGLVPISKLFPFGLAFTEWDAVIQIDEEIGYLDRTTDLSTIPSVQWTGNTRPY
jgi:hypothetical protein